MSTPVSIYNGLDEDNFMYETTFEAKLQKNNQVTVKGNVRESLNICEGDVLHLKVLIVESSKDNSIKYKGGE